MTILQLFLLALAAMSLDAQPKIGACSVFPANNIWNVPVDRLPVATNSDLLVGTVGTNVHLHADFGAGLYQGAPIGIPFITVSGTQPKFAATFQYASESDPGPYAVPLDAPIEGGSSSNGDRHAIAIDTDNCILYELYRAFPQVGSWRGGSGAIYDLRSHLLRPAGWTSADAAGLPIFPGLVRYDEVAAGEIRHAIRVTIPDTLQGYAWPARHYASDLTDPKYPAMGQRFRLKATFDISTYPADARVILTAMKKYGMIVADNGTAWFISGAPDDRWNNNNLALLSNIVGASFEAVDDNVFKVDQNSGQARSCDINGDAAANVVDVQQAVSAVLGMTPCKFQDIDGNGRCDVIDVQRVVSAALGSACLIP